MSDEEVDIRSRFLLRLCKSKLWTLYNQNCLGYDLGQYNIAHTDQINELVEMFSHPSPSHVLDLGCGSGVLSSYLGSKWNAEITGVDLVSPSLFIDHRKTTNWRHSHFLKMDINKLEINPKSFDLIISIDSFYFIKDFKTTMPLLRNVLKSKGRIGILTNVKTGGRISHDDILTVLEENNMDVEYQDFTEDLIKLIQAQKVELSQLEEGLIKEGNIDIYLNCLNEVKTTEAELKKGDVQRVFYYATLQE